MLSVMQSPHGHGLPYASPRTPACLSYNAYPYTPPNCLPSVVPTMRIKQEAPDAYSSCVGTSHYHSPYGAGDNTAILTQQPTMMGIQQQATTYYDPASMHMGMHGEHGAMSHTTRAHPQTIQWLLENYETAEGVSLPRCTLYNHYLRHCAANKIDAVNAASFGKLIRSVFIGLKTRRLGTRGNSKYHYYGIRIKPDSPLNTFPQEDTPVVAMRQTSHTSQREFPVGGSPTEGGEGGAQPELTPQQQHQQYLGDSRPELPQFPEIQWAGNPIPGEVSTDDLNDFTDIYREHCEAILDVVVNLQFQMVENLWHHFWAESSVKAVDTSTIDDESDHQLPKEKIILLTSCQPVIDYINTCDHILYQCIVDFLIPDVLRPIPGTLTQAIRNFAKSLEGWLSGNIHGYSSNLIKAKICSVVAFSQTLRRYTSLNHLAQAARAVLQNPSQISQMLSDLNRVDFANVQEQASWVCECEESLVLRLEQDFKSTLQEQNSLEQWATWLEGVVNTVLEPYEGGDKFSQAARQFLLKWSFYSSMVIRDLTLRSAASFGSFHLIRLLYDEYMFFLIEHKVAKATNKTPIAVMSEFSGHSRRVIAASESITAGNVTHNHPDDEEDTPPIKRQKL